MRPGRHHHGARARPRTHAHTTTTPTRTIKNPRDLGRLQPMLGAQLLIEREMPHEQQAQDQRHASNREVQGEDAAEADIVRGEDAGLQVRALRQAPQLLDVRLGVLGDGAGQAVLLQPRRHDVLERGAADPDPDRGPQLPQEQVRGGGGGLVARAAHGLRGEVPGV